MRAFLEKNISTISEACTCGIDPQMLIKTACLLVKSKENASKLSSCDPMSMLKAITECARYGIDPSFGRGHLIAYGNQVELHLGYLALIDLVKRSKEIKSIISELVREGDYFEVELGSNQRFIHRPKFNVDSDSFNFVYAIATFDDGHFEYTVLRYDEVDRIRKLTSKSPNSPAWKNFLGEMAKKVAIRRLCKTLPLTVEAKEAIQHDDSLTYKSFDEQNKHESFPIDKVDEALNISIENEIRICEEDME